MRVFYEARPINTIFTLQIAHDDTWKTYEN